VVSIFKGISVEPTPGGDILEDIIFSIYFSNPCYLSIVLHASFYLLLLG
jgi:hypothetical protein